MPAITTFVLTCIKYCCCLISTGSDIESKDTTALTGHILIDTALTWIRCASYIIETGAAPGNIVFTLGITTALANTDTLDITASQAIYGVRLQQQHVLPQLRHDY